MKHIVLPIMNQLFEEDVYFHGLDPELVKSSFFLILQTMEDNQQIIEISDRISRIYQIGRNTDWDDVFGNIQNVFLGQDYHCQIDCIVDATGAERAASVIDEIQNVLPRIGVTASVKILFLADLRSPFYLEEQTFYNKLKKAISDAEKGIISLKYNCAYLMLAQTEEQNRLRKRILPFMIQIESIMAKPELRTCGGQIREMDINSIELVPKDLAVKTVCALLCAKPINNPVSMFLLATGSMANKTPREQLDNLKTKLEESVHIMLPSAIDLLVQKGSPDGDISTKDLFARFCEDNPYSNPALYNNAEVELLTQIPEIVNAVYEWENTVIEQACEKGDLSIYIDQLRSGSEFDRLLSDYQNPAVMSADKTLTDRDGYTETALQKLESYAQFLQDSIRNSVFAARLRLIKARMVAMRCRLELVQQARKKAVHEKLAASLTKDVTGLIGIWGKDISTELTNNAGAIKLPKEQDNVADWIESSADSLLEKIPAPDYEAGIRELAESGAKIINNMRVGADIKLITVSLANAVGVPLPDRWIVYKQMISKEEYQRTNEPVVIKVAEWYLNLDQCAQLDEQLFLRPLNQVVTQTSQSADNEPDRKSTNDLESEHEEADLSRLVKKEKEELNTYNGTLNWIWKDMRYTNARLEAFADTGMPDDMKKPVFDIMIRYRSDDRYDIGKKEDLPSGVPLIFRITCLDKGKEVPETVQEIRMRTPRTCLEVELLSVREGKLFGKKPYARLRIKSNGSFSTQHIAVASSTGLVYTADWEQTEDGWISELLPSFENWQVVDRPGDLIEYEIVQ